MRKGVNRESDMGQEDRKRSELKTRGKRERKLKDSVEEVG